jgi:hypothetical protein
VLAALVIVAGLGAAIVLISADLGRETRSAGGPESSSGASEPTTSRTAESSAPGAGPSPAPSTTASPAAGDCTVGEIILRWTPARPPAERVCVHVGSGIVLALPPVEPDEWQAPVSADPRIAAVGPLGLDQEGVTYTTVTTLRTGVVTVSAMARLREPSDLPRTGRSRRLWLLTITVVA